MTDGGLQMIHIDDMRWNRTFFEIMYSSDRPVQLYLYRVKEKRFIPFNMAVEDGQQVARVNVIIAGERAVLSAGQWIICERIDESLLSDVDELLSARPYLWSRMERDGRRAMKRAGYRGEDLEDAETLEEFARTVGFEYLVANPYDTHNIAYSIDILNNLLGYTVVYRYAKKSYAYTISLVAKSNSEGKIYLALEPEFFRRNRNPRVREGSKTFRLKSVASTMYTLFEKCLRPLRKGNRILFLKENGDGPTENMAALQNRMIERGIDQQFKLSYRYRNVFVKHQSVLGWIGDLIAIAKSDYIFVDDYTPVFNFISPAEDTTLVQIWHAGVGFKSVGYARFGITGSPDPYASCHRKYTYALVGNAGLRDIYSEVFGIEESALLATGMPRLDHFLDSETAETARKTLYAKYPYLKSGRVILFAPTFRGAGQRTAHYPYGVIDMEALYNMCVHTNSYFIFEMHHFISKRPAIEERFSDRIVDLSDESLNELFFISDVLVTDYSSCFYDYLLLKRPVVFFTPDREVYTASRGVQRPIDQMAPGVVCDDFESFLSVLENKAYDVKIPDPRTIDRALEGGMLASDRVIDTILFNKDVPGVKLDDE